MGTLRRKAKGFTLLELLLYMGISVTMLAVLASIGITVLESKAKAHAEEEMHYTAAFVMEKVQRAVDRAVSIHTPEMGTTSSSLTLHMEDASNDPTVFEVLDGIMRMTEGEGEPQPISGAGVRVPVFSVSNVTGEHGAGTLRIELQIETYNPEEIQAYHASGTYYTTVGIQQSP